MTSGQKIAFSLLAALGLFAVFVLTLNSTLFKELETRFFTARKDIRESIAYDLATRYYQASPWGDCWYLTHYSWSSNQELNTGEADFVDKAMTYLETSSQSYDKELKRNSLYALAFIPKDSWCNMEYNWKTDSYLYTPIPYSRQYIAFENLDRFLSDNPRHTDPHILR